MPTASTHISSSRRYTLCLGACLVIAGSSLSAQELARVTLTDASRQDIIEELRLTGSLTSPHRAQLSPEVEGRVATIKVEAGDRVNAGDTLLELDDELARLELAQARAAEREAVTELEDARRRLSEVQDLARKGGIVAETDVRAGRAEVERDSAVVERRKAELAHREAIVRRHVLQAPFDGVIAQRATEVGEWVGPDTAVMELVAVDTLRLDVQVPQGYFGRVTLETPVAIDITALPGAPLEAAIGEIVAVSDPTSRTFLARIRLDNTARRMTPGMSARATIRLNTGVEGVVVPRDALVRYPDGRTVVWVASANDDAHTVSERQVKVGLGFAGNVQIVSGIEAGTPVVIRGNEALREGQRVQVERDG